MGEAIEIRRVTKRYGNVRAVDELDLVVSAGETFGFLGPNGSGKTTTIRMLLGLARPSSGEVRVLGKNPASASPALRRRIGYLPGELGFYDEMSGQGFLDFLGGLTGVDTAYRSSLLDRLELSDADLRRKVGHYSKGMRQKVAIVQAFQHRPELLVMDEPTSGLDPLVQMAFFDILKDSRQSGQTVFFSSHILSEVERLCDRIGLVRAGRLVRETSVVDLHGSAERRVVITFRDEVPDRFASMPGVVSSSREGETLSLRVTGDMRPLLSAIAGANIADLVVEPVSLEDVFASLYRES